MKAGPLRKWLISFGDISRLTESARVFVRSSTGELQTDEEVNTREPVPPYACSEMEENPMDMMNDSYFRKNQFPIATRNQANARERDRTHNVNTAFIILRAMIPTEPMDRKLSKIETIRLATKYINHLAAIMMTDAQINPCHLLRESRTHVDWLPNSLCTFCISDYKRYLKSLCSVSPARKPPFTEESVDISKRETASR